MLARRLRLVVILMPLCAAACRTPAPAPPAPPTANSAPGSVRILATAELHGTTEPCGCTSDPLGDLARIAGLASGGLWVDAGDLLYDAQAPSESRRAQADRKAEAIARIYGDARAESAIGPSDLFSFGGGAKIELARQACNAPVEAFAVKASTQVREVNGLRIGVFGVVDPARFLATRDKLPLPARKGLTIPQPPGDAARAAIAALRADGAEIIVGLLSMTRAEARKLLATTPGIDFGVIGLDVEDGMPEVEPVGQGWLLAPADQGRKVARLDIVRRDAPARSHMTLTQWEGAAGRALATERLEKRKKALRAQLDAWKRDPSADPTFIAAREAELVELDKTPTTDVAPPPAGPYFSYALVPIRRALPRDGKVAAALKQLDVEIGRANFAAAIGEVPPPAAAGKPHFVGSAACEKCHKPAVTFWQKTRHAQSWKTLVDAGKQYNYDCIGCHVTGWQLDGGSLLGTVEKQGLVNVQCEVCHGPGSRHVEEQGLDDPKTIARAPANDLCRGRCHTKEHSDTFDEVPYLRDIVGPGHGEGRRRTLGDGVTAHQLRAKATAEAMQ